MNWRGVIEEYRTRLPLGPDVDPITLLEGNTPLLEAPRLAEAIGLDAQLYIKWEGVNPTGSFKDRGMTVAVSKAVSEGSAGVICASTGNTSAAAAAYAARAGIDAYVIIPEGKIALGKLSQALMHGAKIAAIPDNFDRALELVTELANEDALSIVNSINPFRLHGQKTAAFEVCDALGRAPDQHYLPVGNAGNITAYWMGYREYHTAGVVQTLPTMMGFQAAGAAPIVLGHPVAHPETIATAIRIGNPANWRAAEAARDESRGTIGAVSDEEILDAFTLVASVEGIFAEPASAASIAGLTKVNAANRIPGSSVIVCTLTGHGLKDPGLATDHCPPPPKAAADLGAVRKVLQL